MALAFSRGERSVPMRVAITSQGQDIASSVDPRFGRARYFLVVDTETGEVTVADNAQNLNAAQGAGIQAGRTVASLGVQAVITGHVGPKAYRTLQTAGIAVHTGATGSAGDAIEQFKDGRLNAAASADVEGHWM
jgi:predicted Fe-Mo cluster-binding NifX family protein